MLLTQLNDMLEIAATCYIGITASRWNDTATLSTRIAVNESLFPIFSEPLSWLNGTVDKSSSVSDSFGLADVEPCRSTAIFVFHS